MALLMAGLASVLPTPPPSHAAPDRSKLVAAQNALDRLIHEQAVMGERYDAAAAGLQKIQTSLGVLDGQISLLRDRISAQKQKATELARSMYEQGTFADAQFLLSSSSIGDLESRVQMLGSVGAAQNDIFRSLSKDKQTLDRRLTDLGRREESQVVKERKLQDLKAALDAKVASKQQDVQHLEAVIARAEARARRRERLAAARASSAAIPVKGFPADPAPAASPAAQTAVDAVLSQLGKPYVWGATGPGSFDCSGLMLWAWAQAGVSLPHFSGAQYEQTMRVGLQDLQPGDLIFYYHPIEHVAMYIGNEQMVEAPHAGAFVRAVPLRTANFSGAGRPAP